MTGTEKTPEVSESGGHSLEFNDYETQLSPEQEHQIEAAFRLFDSDGNESLEEDEIRSALFALGFLTSFEGNISTLDLSQSFHIKSNTVNLSQFKKIMRGKMVRRSELEEIQMTFCAIVEPAWVDQNTSTRVDVSWLLSQTIDLNKLRHACHCFEVKLTDEELNNILDETDINHDRGVDWHEYVSILKHSCWF